MKTLLLIANLASLSTLRKSLCQHGYIIHVAYDGQDALRLIEENRQSKPCDAAICDCGLTELSNQNPSAFIRKIPIETKIILIGNNPPDLKNHIEREKKQIKLLQKNFSINELLSIIEK